MNKLEKLVDYLRADGHADDAEALIVVDHLMREYAFSHDPMEENAKVFSRLLQDLVADWGKQMPPTTKTAIVENMFERRTL